MYIYELTFRPIIASIWHNIIITMKTASARFQRNIIIMILMWRRARIERHSLNNIFVIIVDATRTLSFLQIWAFLLEYIETKSGHTCFANCVVHSFTNRNIRIFYAKEENCYIWSGRHSRAWIFTNSYLTNSKIHKESIIVNGGFFAEKRTDNIKIDHFMRNHYARTFFSSFMKCEEFDGK